MSEQAPKRFNPDLCTDKHKVINARIKEIKEVQRDHSIDIVDLKEIVVRLTTLNEKQENKESPKIDWLNTPAGLMVLKVGIMLFLIMFAIATGFNVIQFMN